MTAEEIIESLLKRVEALETKTRGISCSTPEEEEAAEKRRGGNGGDVSLRAGKANKEKYPGARDGRIVLKEADGKRLAVFDFDTLQFKPLPEGDVPDGFPLKKARVKAGDGPG